MIEALIKTRNPGRASLNPNEPVKRKGDVIAVGLEGTRWGANEITIVKIDDPVIEARLNAMKDRGDPNPKIVYPYMQGNTCSRKRVMTEVPRGRKLNPHEYVLLED